MPALLDQVLETPDMPARRLGEFLGNWSRFGAVDVPGELGAELAEWQTLERCAVEDRMAIHLRRISAGSTRPLRPGATGRRLQPGVPEARLTV